MDKHFRLRALALAVGSALILAACGGSGSTASALSGNAAEGLAIANTTLTARDALGNTRSTTTDASGNYTLDTAGLRFPLMLQITGSKGVWHALVSADDAGRSANINNATDSVALLALGLSSSAALQNAFTKGSFRQISATRIAEAGLRAVLVAHFDAVGLHRHVRRVRRHDRRLGPDPAVALGRRLGRHCARHDRTGLAGVRRAAHRWRRALPVGDEPSLRRWRAGGGTIPGPGAVVATHARGARRGRRSPRSRLRTAEADAVGARSVPKLSFRRNTPVINAF